MPTRYKQLKQAFLQHAYWLAALLLLISLFAGYQSYQHKLSADLTNNQRNSLSQQSRSILDQMPDTISIQAYSSDSATKGKYFRKAIMQLIQPYQAYQSNIQLSYLDPRIDIAQARQAGFKYDGDLLIHYHGRSQRLSLPYSEERLSNVLNQLQASQKQTLFFTSGHGEGQLNNHSNKGLSTLAKQLTHHGFHLKQSADLQHLATDKQVLVIHGAKHPFNAQESALVSKHIQAGGHLIWLIDTPPPYGLESLLNTLDMQVSNGTVVDLSNAAFGVDPQMVSATHLSSHAVLKDYSLRAIFPQARRVYSKQSKRTDWQATPLIGVAENGWLTQRPATDFSKEALVDNIALRGPVNIAVAIEKKQDKKAQQQQQRILIIGNSQFLQNDYVNKAGNQQLADKLFKWISDTAIPVSIPPKIAKDRIIAIPHASSNQYLILAIFNGFQFVLPALLFFMAGLSWYRKKYDR